MAFWAVWSPPRYVATQTLRAAGLWRRDSIKWALFLHVAFASLTYRRQSQNDSIQCKFILVKLPCTHRARWSVALGTQPQSEDVFQFSHTSNIVQGSCVHVGSADLLLPRHIYESAVDHGTHNGEIITAMMHQVLVERKMLRVSLVSISHGRF